MKANRQQAIINIINNNKINTQEELADFLKQAGFNTTQATISRDIKELNIVKLQSEDGYRYFSPTDSTDGPTSFNSLFKSAVNSIEPAGNIIAIKCLSGMAQAVCAAMDASSIGSIIATLAGDDTIFALCANAAKAKETAKTLQRIMGR